MNMPRVGHTHVCVAEFQDGTQKYSCGCTWILMIPLFYYNLLFVDSSGAAIPSQPSFLWEKWVLMTHMGLASSEVKSNSTWQSGVTWGPGDELGKPWVIWIWCEPPWQMLVIRAPSSHIGLEIVVFKSSKCMQVPVHQRFTTFCPNLGWWDPRVGLYNPHSNESPCFLMVFSQSDMNRRNPPVFCSLNFLLRHCQGPSGLHLPIHVQRVAVLQHSLLPFLGTWMVHLAKGLGCKWGGGKKLH